MVDAARTIDVVRLDDKGKVTEKHTVTPEVARVLENQGFTRATVIHDGPADADIEDRIALAVADATEEADKRIAELEAQLADAQPADDPDPMPENVKDIEAWVERGTTSRAQAALDAETVGQKRPTLLAHLDGVLNPPPPGDDSATGGKEA